MKSFAILLFVGMAVSSHATLIGHWELNEPSGNVADSSGNGYTGLSAIAGTGRVHGLATVPAGVYGAITVSLSQSSAFGTSIDFGTATGFGNFNLNAAGTSAVDALMEPGTGGNHIDGAMTVMAWVNLDETTGVQSIFSSNVGGGNGWRFGTNGTELRFTTLGAQDFSNPTAVNLATNTWYHMAVTVNNDLIEFFLNGASVGTRTATVNYIEENTGFEVKLGGKAMGLENMYGRMDDVKIFDSALTASEIQAAAIPEPATMTLLLLAGITAALRLRR